MTAKPLAQAIAGGGTEESQERRKDGDFFPTPLDVAYVLLDNEPILKGGPLTIWEPHCGEGHLANAIRAFGHNVIATDIKDRGYADGSVADFFEASQPESVDGIIMNPPFNNITAHIKRALGFSHSFLIALTPAEFWARKKHLDLFAKHPPSRVYPVAWKPDFTGGGSGIFCVQWCVWDLFHDGPTEFRPLARPSFVGTGTLL